MAFTLICAQNGSNKSKIYCLLIFALTRNIRSDMNESDNGFVDIPNVNKM